MDVQTKVAVTLAGKDYVVKQVPMARIKRLGAVVAEAVQDVDKANLTNQDGVTAVIDKILDAPHALLSIFIDDLPKEIFHDEDAGVTLPELLDVVEKAFTLNRVDKLKNVFSRLVPMMQQQQASTSKKTS